MRTKTVDIGIYIFKKQKITTKPTQDSEIIIHLLYLLYYFIISYFIYDSNSKRSLAIMMLDRGQLFDTLK